MLTDRILAFAELGRLFQSMSLDFADSTSVTDPGILEEVRSLLDEEVGGVISRVFDLSLNSATNTFKGKAEQKLNLAKSQFYQFEMSPNTWDYKLIPVKSVNPNMAEFDEADDADWIGAIEFAAAQVQSKSARAGKKLNCKPGNIQCGGKCQDGEKYKCKYKPNPQQAKEVEAIAAKVKAEPKGKGSASDSPAASDTPKPSPPKTETKPESTAAEPDRLELKRKLTGLDRDTLEKIQPILQKKKQGESLTPEEEAFSQEVNQKLKVNKLKVFAEDGSELQIEPKYARLLSGNRVVSKSELAAAGISDASTIDKSDIQRLTEIRNGFNSQEEFLSTPPTITKEKYTANPDPKISVETQKTDRFTTLYSGKRVALTITEDGDVEFTVDGAFSLNDRDSTNPPPNSELKAMTKAFNSYINSNAGKRVLYTVPTTDDERGDTRIKLYERRGFEITKGNRTGKKNRKVLMVLDNSGK